MNRSDLNRVTELTAALLRHHATTRHLPGIEADGTADSLARNIVQSLRRERYPATLAKRSPSLASAHPDTQQFDPYMAAIALHEDGRPDEAFWVVFLLTHFGEHGTSGWPLLRAVYGALGSGVWDWQSVSADPASMCRWIAANADQLRAVGSFGNHRKYESVVRTPKVIESYVAWLDGRRHHEVVAAPPPSGGDPAEAFDRAYKAMDVERFGRLGRFDYLSLTGKLGLADVVPGHPYLHGSSGPQYGARLLFTGDTAGGGSLDWLTERCQELARVTGIGFDPMEDALCNWQKNPLEFNPFAG